MIEVKDILNKAIGLGACSNPVRQQTGKVLCGCFSLHRDANFAVIIITLQWRCFAQ